MSTVALNPTQEYRRARRKVLQLVLIPAFVIGVGISAFWVTTRGKELPNEEHLAREGVELIQPISPTEVLNRMRKAIGHLAEEAREAGTGGAGNSRSEGTKTQEGYSSPSVPPGNRGRDEIAPLASSAESEKKEESSPAPTAPGAAASGEHLGLSDSKTSQSTESEKGETPETLVLSGSGVSDLEMHSARQVEADEPGHPDGGRGESSPEIRSVRQEERLASGANAAGAHSNRGPSVAKPAKAPAQETSLPTPHQGIVRINDPGWFMEQAATLTRLRTEAELEGRRVIYLPDGSTATIEEAERARQAALRQFKKLQKLSSEGR